METWHDSEILYEGRIIRVRVGRARLDDGSLQVREVVEHSGGVAVVPYHDGMVTLVRQHRIAVGKAVLELPAGRLEPGDTPERRALVELEEETGWRAGRLEHVASCYCSPGFCTELDHIYLALELTPCAARPEFDEVIERVDLSLDEVRSMLRERSFDDAKTIIGLQALLARGYP